MRMLHFYINVRSAERGEEVAVEDACEVGLELLFYVDTIFTFLAMLDPQRMKAIDGESLCTGFANLGEIGMAFTSEACARLEQIEGARKELIKASQDKEGKQ